MARKTSTRKPAPKRRAPARGKAKPKRSFATFGWLAAAALGVGWMVSDGRPLTYATALVSPPSTATRLASRPERPAPSRAAETRREAAVAVPPVAIPAPRTGAADRLRVAALPAAPTATPRPAPRLGALKMPADDAPPPVRAARPAAAVPAAALETASAAPARRAPEPVVSVTPAMAPAGSEHHATRRLPMRAAPDGAARILASIDSGTEVHVLRAEGPWRYVTSAGGRSEGWVDGTYLAGEATTPLRAPTRQQTAPGREAVALLAPFSPTQARQGSTTEFAGPRTRLPPAAIRSQ